MSKVVAALGASALVFLLGSVAPTHAYEPSNYSVEVPRSLEMLLGSASGPETVFHLSHMDSVLDRIRSSASDPPQTESGAAGRKPDSDVEEPSLHDIVTTALKGHQQQFEMWLAAVQRAEVVAAKHVDANPAWYEILKLQVERLSSGSETWQLGEGEFRDLVRRFEAYNRRELKRAESRLRKVHRSGVAALKRRQALVHVLMPEVVPALSMNHWNSVMRRADQLAQGPRRPATASVASHAELADHFSRSVADRLRNQDPSQLRNVYLLKGYRGVAVATKDEGGVDFLHLARQRSPSQKDGKAGQSFRVVTGFQRRVGHQWCRGGRPSYRQGHEGQSGP